MGRKYVIRDSAQLHFVSFATVNWIDVFVRRAYREMLWMFARAGKRNSNNEKYQFWQQNNHPIELHTPEMRMQRLNYLHNNPVVSGCVSRPEDYLFSSAFDYCGGTGLLPAILIS